MSESFGSDGRSMPDGVHISSGGDTHVSPDSVISGGGGGGGVHISSGGSTHISAGSVISGGDYHGPYPRRAPDSGYDRQRGFGQQFVPWTYADWQRNRPNSSVFARMARRVTRAFRRISRR